jgi:hypothetical protein
MKLLRHLWLVCHRWLRAIRLVMLAHRRPNVTNIALVRVRCLDRDCLYHPSMGTFGAPCPRADRCGSCDLDGPAELYLFDGKLAGLNNHPHCIRRVTSSSWLADEKDRAELRPPCAPPPAVPVTHHPLPITSARGGS